VERTTEFRILGAVEARAEDRPLALGGPKQRALLAVLLLRANRAVSRDELVDSLWGADPPRSAVQSLQVYVHGLRQALGAERIETVGNGYRLHVRPGELDSARFDELVAGAERSLAAGAPSEAAEKLDGALALWRGTPLADLSGEPVAETSTPVLTERRLRALELRGDAQQALGRHEQLTPQLEELVAAEPYRERFHAQHMLALYRAGRQKDALEAYRHARETLLELGVDPSADLQELERRILQQDATLAAPATREPAGVKLPVPPTSLVGRRLEVAAVIGLLRGEDARLLTLTGPGGTGKTRLALAVATELGPALADGAAFVDLAALDDASLLAPTIAHALEIAEGSSAEDALVEHLHDRRLLLVLDNVEQLVPDVALIGRLVAAAPRLLVLATSRTPLRLAAEHEYPVPPLTVPGGGASFEEIAASDAVRLFVARARAVEPGFALDESSARAVAHVCERLDGLPLGIELAAARSKLFNPRDLSARLDRRLDLLTGGPRDVPPRQQTLRATLEWSHEQLTDPDRDVFARLGVFAGGWTIDAAETVCGEGDVLGALARLVDNSLARRVERPTGHRFAMLETIGEYAREQLARSDEAARVRRRHADYFLQLSTDTRPGLLAVDAETFARFDDEYDNLRAALRCFADDDDVVSEVRLLDALWNFYTVRGHLSELRALLEGAVARSADADAHTRALARIHCGACAFRQGDLTRARQLTEEALALARGLGDDDEVARCIGTLGNIAFAEGDLDRAVELYEEAAHRSRASGHRSRLAVLLANLGSLAGQRDDAETSALYAREAAEIQRDLGERDGLAVSLHNLGRAELSLSHPVEARAALTESLQLARELGYREVIAYVLSGLAELALLDEENERAAKLLGASEDLFREIGVALEHGEAVAQHRILTELYATLGSERTDELREHGARTPFEELV
jgi:predicted ATPase/DNA-binding SARP family transcriptional activator